MNSSALRIIVAAGGTGGDLFPAVAVIEQLQKHTEVEALFVGNPHRIEARVAPQLGFRFEALSVRGYKGWRSMQSYALPLTIAHSTLRVRRLIREFRPHVALCAGTYISYPLAIAASQAKVPIVLIESNAIPGKANRSVAKRASLIVAAFEESRRFFDARARDKVQVFGNPIRQGFATLPTRAEAAAVFGLNPNLFTLLVFGGSLGARSINTAIERSLDVLQRDGIQVLWQTGSQYSSTVALPSTVHRLAFIDDMASAYAAADVVLCRAGGGTVAELSAVAKAAVLIPYPYAANNEQEHNARAFEDKGAAIMIRDSDVVEKFPTVVLGLLRDSARLKQMSSAMSALAKPQAAADAARAVLALTKR